MTTTDWTINIALVAVVVLQLKERRFTWHAMLLPLGGVSYAAVTYRQALPTGGNDLVLIALTVAAGAAPSAPTTMASPTWCWPPPPDRLPLPRRRRASAGSPPWRVRPEPASRRHTCVTKPPVLRPF